MELIALPVAEYQGKPFAVTYRTTGYYDIEPQDDGFRLTCRAFDAAQEKTLRDTFFGEWLENPVAFGAFEDGRMLGFVEGAMETWNNRFRISNICVFDENSRRNGLGGRLMNRILQTARDCGARMVVLETQTCNERAIAFYRKHGFRVIGFDLYAYANDDPQRHEVRLEMGRML